METPREPTSRDMYVTFVSSPEGRRVWEWMQELYKNDPAREIIYDIMANITDYLMSGQTMISPPPEPARPEPDPDYDIFAEPEEDVNNLPF
jgi:hypothetical protein